MRVDAFDFHLPDENIALRPSEPREHARLLIVKPDHSPHLDDRTLADLPQYLEAGDCIVVNDTRVLPARLIGYRKRGDAQAKIEATLHKREAPDCWRAFFRPAKKLNIGEEAVFVSAEDPSIVLAARLIERGEGGEGVFRFSMAGTALDHAIAAVGHMPLPPYIAARRAEDAQDKSDYQTIFADRVGAVAAPTAGLHFTPALVAACKARGVEIVRVTLHVGAGTFLPVKVEDTQDHKMHAEWGEVTAATADALNACRARGGRIIAIGTTSLRTLESAVTADGQFVPWASDTSIFITPGYHFRAVDILLTNFHLPKSTLFMLVSAFSGLDLMQEAYKHAIATGYRFYSYGDACLLHCASRARPTDAV